MCNLHEKTSVLVNDLAPQETRAKESGMVLLYFVFLLGMLTLLATMLSSSVLPGASAAHDTITNEQRRARVEIARNVLYAFTTVRSDGERVMEREVFNLFKDLKSKQIEFDDGNASNTSNSSSASSAWKISVWKVDESASSGKGTIYFRVPEQLRSTEETVEFLIVEGNAETPSDTSNADGDSSPSAAPPSEGTSSK